MLTEDNKNTDNRLVSNLQMEGFFREEFISSMTSNPGVYFVFIGVRREKGCLIKRCIYIGKAEEQGVQHRLSNHEKMEEFHKKMKENEGTILYFAYAECSTDVIKDVEGALIKGIRPEINSQSTESFSSKYDVIELNLSGSVPVIFAEFKSLAINPDAKE